VSRWWKVILAAAGIAFFAWYLSGVGLEEVWHAVKGMGPYAPLVLAPYFVVYVVDCFAWSRTLPRPSLTFFTLFRIRWAGESVNSIFPSAYVGGETVKVLLLREKGVSATQGATSAVVSKTAQTVAQLIFIIIASVFLFSLARALPGIRAGTLFVAVGGLAALGMLVWARKIGLFRIVGTVQRKFPFKIGALERRKAKLLEVDQTILRFYREEPKKFYSSIALYFAGWMLDMVEIYLVAHLLGMPISWAQALVVEAFTGLAKALGMWIPGSLGVQESGIVLVGRLLGLPETLTAAYALIRRTRELIFAGVGLSFLYASHIPRGNLSARPANI
jgi:uncharacterized protein (TIRG00374 family)